MRYSRSTVGARDKSTAIKVPQTLQPEVFDNLGAPGAKLATLGLWMSRHAMESIAEQPRRAREGTTWLSLMPTKPWSTPMGAISNRMPAVTVVYDRGKVRAEKTFANPYEAKRFYALKLKANKNPELRKVN